MLPSIFDQANGFSETVSMVKSIRYALEATHPQRVVCLSTIGAQATQSNLLSKLGIMERSLSALPVPVAFLRAAWFMENAARDIQTAMTTGRLPASCSRLTSQCRWFPRRTSDRSPRNYPNRTRRRPV